MNTYRFNWKKRFSFWKSKLVVGHRWDKDLDHMVLYLPDGTIYEIPEWSKTYCRLGLDWKESIRQSMEKESGQSIKVAL